VAFVLAASFLRNASGAIQSSLFVVYLNGAGIGGTVIGTLVAVAELAGVFGSLIAATMERRIGSNRLVLGCIAIAIIAIASTPLIGTSLLLLGLACVVRGIVQGLSQPLMYSMLSVEVPGNRHGASVGLRNAVVRLASIITPAVMGWVAQSWGIEASFYVIGGAYLFATAVLGVFANRGAEERRA
jgi:MFS family permease